MGRLWALGSGWRELIRVWQIQDCIIFEQRHGWQFDLPGWKLLRVDEIRLFSLLQELFPTPRSGYRRDDQDSWLMFCQL